MCIRTPNHINQRAKLPVIAYDIRLGFIPAAWKASSSTKAVCTESDQDASACAFSMLSRSLNFPLGKFNLSFPRRTMWSVSKSEGLILPSSQNESSLIVNSNCRKAMSNVAESLLDCHKGCLQKVRGLRGHEDVPRKRASHHAFLDSTTPGCHR